MSRLATLTLFTSLLLISGCAGPFSTLDPAGPAAGSVALLWWGMLLFSTLVLTGVTVLWLVAMRRDPGEGDDAPVERVQNRWIWGGGLALPLGSIIVLLAFGIPIGHSLLPLPSADGDVVEIEVTGHQWWWAVHYPGSGLDLQDEVVIPAETPIDIVLRSEDVIHSFWVPRLGGKTDMIPGHTNRLRLQADAPGTYRGQCAEFCGVAHAHMQFTVTALSPDDYADWLAEQTDEEGSADTDD